MVVEEKRLKKEENMGSAPDWAQPSYSQPSATEKGVESRGSGRYQNLQKFVQAQDQQFGQRLGEKVGQKAQQFGKDIQKEKSKFSGQIQQNKDQLSQAEDIRNQIKQDPTKLSEDQTGFYKNLTGGQFASNVQDQLDPNLTSTQNILKQSQQYLGQTEDEAGRFNLLKDVYGKPGQRYTPGMQALDQLILQTDPTAFNQLSQQAVQQGQNIGQQLASSREQAKTAYENLLNDIDTTGQGLLDLTKSEEETLLSDQQQEAAVAAEKNQKILDALNAGEIDKKTAIQLGFNPGYNYNLSTAGLDLSNYLEIPTEFQGTQFIDENEAAKLNALAQLSGSGQQYATGDTPSIGWKPGFSASQFSDLVRQEQSNITKQLDKISQEQQKIYDQGYGLGLDRLESYLQNMTGTGKQAPKSPVRVDKGVSLGGSYDSAIRQLGRQYGVNDIKQLASAAGLGIDPKMPFEKQEEYVNRIAPRVLDSISKRRDYLSKEIDPLNKQAAELSDLSASGLRYRNLFGEGG